MKHKIFYDEKTEVVRVIVSGEFTRDHAEESINIIRSLFQDKKDRDLLCYVSGSTNVFESSETRRRFRT